MPMSEATPGEAETLATAPPAGEAERITLRAIATVFCATLCTAMYAFTWNSVSVALPYMQGTFSATTDQIAWVIIAYVIGASVVTGCSGWLSARFGRKQVFLFAIAGFIVTLVGCAQATTLWEEVFWRFAQGMMAAPMLPLGQSIAVAAFPRSRYGQATSLWALGFVSANVVSPVIGGILIENWGWQYIFHFSIPFGVLGFVMAWFLVPWTPAEKTRLEWLGFTSLVVGVGVLQLMLARGERLEWFASGEVLIETAIAAVALYIFIFHTITGRNTFIDGSLFLNRNFAMGQIMIFLIGSVMFLPLILLPLQLQQIGGYPAIETGYLMLPRGLGSIVGLTLMAYLRDRVDPRPLLIIGIVFIAWPAWEMGHWTPDIRPRDVTWTTFIQGLAAGFIWAPLNTLTLSRLDRRVQDQGFALFYLLFDVGSAIGTAVVIGLLAHYSQINHEELNAFIHPFNELLRYPGLESVWDTSTTTGLAILQEQIGRQALMIGYNNAFMVVGGIMAICLPLVFVFRNPRDDDALRRRQGG
ncbi:MAG: DHA2 family efflux MFS transporter permease subunit [Rhodospirillales bacterium]|nr:DHA2 family efflux MFS transporter permease subunit [Rhodospirillales bacterium]